jgi:hypothetical protein
VQFRPPAELGKWEDDPHSPGLEYRQDIAQHGSAQSQEHPYADRPGSDQALNEFIVPFPRLTIVQEIVA